MNKTKSIKLTSTEMLTLLMALRDRKDHLKVKEEDTGDEIHFIKEVEDVELIEARVLKSYNNFY